MPISISDAAAALGFRSRSTLYRLLEQGLLKDWEREGPKGLAVTGAGGSPGQGPEVCASSKQQPQGECGSDGGRPPNPDQRDIGGLPLLAAGDPSGQWVPGCQLLGPAAVVYGSVGDPLPCTGDGHGRGPAGDLQRCIRTSEQPSYLWNLSGLPQLKSGSPNALNQKPRVNNEFKCRRKPC